jgi:hypothetical protein
MNANDVTENLLVIDQPPRDLPAYGPGSLSEWRVPPYDGADLDAIEPCAGIDMMPEMDSIYGWSDA